MSVLKRTKRPAYPLTRTPPPPNGAFSSGGVPPGSIITDFASWDTVGNAWFARMAVEAILDMSYRVGDRASEPHAAPPPPPRTHTATPPVDAAAAGAPSPLSRRPLPYPGSAIPAGGGGKPSPAGAGAGTGDGDVKKDDDDDERKSAEEEVTGTGTATAGVREAGVGAAWEATQKETKRADALAAAAAAAAAQTGAGAGGAGEEKEKLPAARAGEAYGGGEMRKWMFDWKAKKARARRGPLNVTVFSSDFHADRMDAVFQWVFGLEPSLLKGKTTVTVRRRRTRGCT